VIFEVHGRTDRGRKRESNEDGFLIADLDAGTRMPVTCSVGKTRGEAGLFCAVSDGMGGARAGEVASQMALQVVLDALLAARLPSADSEGELLRSFLRANEAVFRRSETDAACRGMGTTLTAVVISERTCFLGHVGDSRAYLHHRGVLRQLTRDHSLMNFLIDYGVMSSDQAEALVNRNIILEALGVKRDVSVDTGSLSLERGDTILLCTDGLYATMSDEEIRDRIAADAGLEALARDLIEEANRRGGPDNITVLLCRVVG
jgi:serine/threonine protein phosphatase PrpC